MGALLIFLVNLSQALLSNGKSFQKAANFAHLHSHAIILEAIEGVW